MRDYDIEPDLDMVLAGYQTPDDILRKVTESFNTEYERLRGEAEQRGASL